MITTWFYDLCTGGTPRIPYDRVLVEASPDTAKVVFEKLFQVNPDKKQRGQPVFAYDAVSHSLNDYWGWLVSNCEWVLEEKVRKVAASEVVELLAK